MTKPSVDVADLTVNMTQNVRERDKKAVKLSKYAQ